MNEETIFVKENLRIILQEYRKSRAKLSLRSIARNIGVNRYFLSKVLEDNDSVKLDLDQMLVFWKFMTSIDPVNDNFQKQLELLKKYLHRYFGYTDANEILLDLPKKDLDLYDRNNFLIIFLACCDYGISKDKIISILGETCIPNLEEMLEGKFIVESEDHKIRIPENKPVWFTHGLIRYHLNDILRFYQENHRGINYLNLTVQGLSKEALEKAVAIQKDCGKRIEKLILDKNNWGPNPVFFVLCLDAMSIKVE